jgi:serine protease inhibitor
VEIVNDVIITKAFFNKTLPFPSKLQKLDEPISFNKTNVSAFGIKYYDEEAAKFTEILYYKDDDHFALKLMPKDNEHQIILAKGTGNVANLATAIKQTNDLINIANNEKKLPKTAWKYNLNDIDIFSIPIIKFNIEKNYSEIEGQTFTTNGKRHHVEEAYQRTGFMLDENGAVVESQAYTTTDSIASEPMKIQPKRMIFDKPFLIIIKRTKKDNPYFVMYVQNTELLTKE